MGKQHFLDFVCFSVLNHLPFLIIRRIISVTLTSSVVASDAKERWTCVSEVTILQVEVALQNLMLLTFL